MPLGEQSSLGLHCQLAEPQLMCDPAQESHLHGETGEAQDLSDAEHLFPGQAKTRQSWGRTGLEASLPGSSSAAHLLPVWYSLLHLEKTIWRLWMCHVVCKEAFRSHCGVQL